MANIGSFKKVGGELQGEIVTLSVQTKGVRIVPEANGSTTTLPAIGSLSAAPRSGPLGRSAPTRPCFTSVAGSATESASQQLRPREGQVPSMRRTTSSQVRRLCQDSWRRSTSKDHREAGRTAYLKDHAAIDRNAAKRSGASGSAAMSLPGYEE